MEKSPALKGENAVQNTAYCPYCMTPTAPGERCPHCGLTDGAYVPAPHHLPPGTLLLDRYLVGRVLGEGGFGITYIGCDLRLELRVAIKEYFPVTLVSRRAQESLLVSHYPGMGGFESGKARFLTEARTMAKMDKTPEIAGVRDFFEENDTAYIVMEYLDGTTFKELVRQKGGRIEAGELLRLIEPLFGALGAMHKMGLIHRDISPDNLMLEHGAVRLLDFGCARESLEGSRTMTIALKHGYAPIEQYQYRGQGPWTDVYALSATIYFCLTGRVPPQALDRMVEDELIQPRKLGVALTDRQEKALLRGMGLRQHQRFRSMEELHAALYGSPQPESAPRPESGPRPESVPQTESAPRPESGSQPESAPQPESVPRPESGPQPESGSQPAPAARGARIPRWARFAGAGAAAAVLLLALVLVFLPLLRGESPADAPAPAPGAQADAAVLGPEAGEAELRAALADAGVSAVVVPAGCSIAVADGPMEVTKSLCVEEGAELFSLGSLTVGPGGLLRVEGRLRTGMGLVRAAEGGAIAVGATGELTGSGAVFLAAEESLTVEPGGRAEVDGWTYGDPAGGARFLCVDEAALFAEAVRVSSYEDLCQALESPETAAVIVEGEVRLRGQVVSRVPLLVAEGATLAQAEGVGERGLLLDGATLVNRGTIRCGIGAGDGDEDAYADVCALVNFGYICGDLFLDCPGALLNLGTVEISGGAQLLRTDLYNQGTIALRGAGKEAYLDLLCGTAVNAGRLDVGSEGRLTLGCTRRFCNEGQVDVARGATLEIQSGLYNSGRIAVQSGGRLENNGYLEATSGGAALLLDEQAALYNNGLILAGRGDALALPADYAPGENAGRIAAFRRNAREGARTVSTEAELRAALADERCALVALEGEVAVQGDLTVRKVLDASSGALSLAGGQLTVSGRAGFFFGEADLGGGALVLEAGAAAAPLRLENAGRMSLSDASVLVAPEALRLQSAALRVESGSQCIAAGGLHLSACEVDVGESAVLRTRDALELCGCTVRISAGGEFLPRNGDLDFDAETEVQNLGGISLEANTSFFSAEIAGRVENRGWMEVGMPLCVRGRLQNAGSLETQQPLSVVGTVENQGQILLAGEAAELEIAQGGVLTGAPAERVPDWVDIREAAGTP